MLAFTVFRCTLTLVYCLLKAFLKVRKIYFTTHIHSSTHSLSHVPFWRIVNLLHRSYYPKALIHIFISVTFILFVCMFGNKFYYTFLQTDRLHGVAEILPRLNCFSQYQLVGHKSAQTIIFNLGAHQLGDFIFDYTTNRYECLIIAS